LQDGKFWPARLNSTKLGDVYGVVMDRQRGNRPIILPRDDLLKEAVRDDNFLQCFGSGSGSGLSGKFVSVSKLKFLMNQN
jgi:hypothetical protein